MSGRRDNIAERMKRAVADRLPAPMAAPETPRLRRLRITLIVELAAIAVLTASWEPLVRVGARIPAAFLWLTLAIGALLVGVRWLTAKIRADKAWEGRSREP